MNLEAFKLGVKCRDFPKRHPRGDAGLLLLGALPMSEAGKSEIHGLENFLVSQKIQGGLIEKVQAAQ